MLTKKNSLKFFSFIVRFWKSKFIGAATIKTFSARFKVVWILTDKRFGKFEREMLFANAFFARKNQRMRHAPIFEHSAQDFFDLIVADKFTFPKPDDKKEEFERVFFSQHSDIGTVIPCRNNVLVGSIRDLEKEANYRPYESKARFFIIDDADKMNDAASNALLKTLEEPQITTYIFLITSRPYALLTTILSRCQILRFAPISANEIKTHLLETKQFAPDDARDW